MDTSWIGELKSIVRGDLWTNEPMKFHTVFRIGGPADALVVPTDREDLLQILRFGHERQVPVHVIGQGSNLLVSDDGVDGIVIRLGKSIGELEWEGDQVTVGAGAPLPSVGWKLAKRGLRGLEFGVGIPGSVGGAVTMNAGAHGGDMSHVVESVLVVGFQGGDPYWIKAAEIGFAYRSSRFLRDRELIVLAARLQLQPDDPKKIEAQMQDVLEYRRRTQPLGQPGAGSIFKNPPGDYSGRLIEATGLKGTRRGGAEVSPIHANFIVNAGEATASEVIALIRLVQQRVYDQFGILLEPEVQVLGRGLGEGKLPPPDFVKTSAT